MNRRRRRRGAMVLRNRELLKTLMDGRFTSRSLGEEAGCSEKMIGHLRTGQRTSCSRELALRIAAALGVETGVLFAPTAGELAGDGSYLPRRAPRGPQDPDALFRKRTEARLTQKQVAQRAGLSPAKMSRIERGAMAATGDVLDRIAGVLGCEISDLMAARDRDRP